MKTVFEHLDQRLLEQAGLAKPPAAPFAHLSFEALHALTCSDGFCEKMDNRLMMGHLRYGPSYRALGHLFYATKAEERLALYKADGNLEHLVDAANFLRLEARESRHPLKHFHAQDRT